ncbi:polysaccharide biosynthesis/export family protein [Roseobacter sp. A03A-229]
MKYILIALWGLMLTVTSVSAQSNYRIQPGDTISIEVLEDTSLNRSLLVLPDGTVDFPFAGSIRVGGQSTSQVQQTLTANLASNFATPPTVFVSVNSVFTDPLDALGAGVPSDAINVYFTGEINAPGLRPMASRTTFLQAIAQSGGFTRFAATKRVQLRRTDSSGKHTVYTINYKALANGAGFENDIILQDGDVILVPERRLFE